MDTSVFCGEYGIVIVFCVLILFVCSLWWESPGLWVNEWLNFYFVAGVAKNERVWVYTEMLFFCSFVVLNEQNSTLFLEIPVLSGWKCFQVKKPGKTFVCFF